jgi:hypothetical protein
MANNQIALLAQAPVLDTPFESQGKALQLRQLMNQGAVQDMDMAQRRQAIADDAGARNVFATENDPAARIQALYKINPKAAQAFEKAQTDIAKDTASTAETKAKTQNEQLKAVNMRLQQARDLLGNVKDKQGAATWVQGLYADPDIGKFLTQHIGPVEQALAGIPDAQTDPQGFANWRRASQLSAEKLVETTMPKLGTRDLGGKVQSTLTDPITGKVMVTDNSAKSQTPDSVASTAVQRERLAFDRAQPKGQVVQTDQGVMLVDPRTGKAQPVTANGEALQPKLRQLPAAVQKSISENSASLRKVDTALAELDKYPDAFGLKNYLGDTIRQRSDPQGVTARAFTADIGSMIIHDRSGAAVTASETPRLKPFIPATTDDPATIKKKLTRFRDEYKAIQEDMVSMYSRDQGYRQPGAAPTAPVAGGKPTLGQIFGE